MPKNTSISLGDHFIQFIDRGVASGRYASASDVVRAGLRLLEEHEDRVRTLQQALIAGEQSGDPKVIDKDDFLARMNVSQAS